MFLENRSDTVHKYGHVVLRALSASYTLKRSHNVLVPAVEVTANESNEPSKAELIRIKSAFNMKLESKSARTYRY